MVKVYCIDVNEISDEGFERIAATLSEERLKKTERIVRGSEKKLSLAAGYLLHFALRAEGVENPSFVYGECGKPYLKGGGVYFNLSHSGNVAVCAVANSEVGIDVQKVRRLPHRLAAKICTVGEAASFGGNEDGLCLLWSVKESVMKYFGKGLSLSPHRISASSVGGITVTVDGADVGLSFAHYSPCGHHVVVCALGEQFPPQMIKLAP